MDHSLRNAVSVLCENISVPDLDILLYAVSLYDKNATLHKEKMGFERQSSYEVFRHVRRAVCCRILIRLMLHVGILCGIGTHVCIPRLDHVQNKVLIKVTFENKICHETIKIGSYL